MDHALSELKSESALASGSQPSAPIENKVQFEENPEIKIEIKEKKIDLSAVQIRKPLKDRAGSD